MPSPFQSRSVQGGVFRKHPTWFGVPFILIIVGASFGLSKLTQTRYDLQAQKVTEVSAFHIRYIFQKVWLIYIQLNEAELNNIKKNRKRVDLREEYFVHSILHAVA